MKLRVSQTRRMLPITKTDEAGVWIVGYERKGRSRKAGKIMLRTPIMFQAAPKEASA